MLKGRRTAASALVLGVGALALTGCFSPPPLPTQEPVEPTATEELEPTTEAEPTTEPEPSTSSDPGAAGDLPFTVDDGIGDTWSFDVVELVANPPLASGEPEPGTFVVGVIIDAEHVEGGASFTTCFDILVEGSDGETYDYADTLTSLTPEDDLFYVGSDDSFSGAVAAVQMPEGVDPVQVTVRSTFGYPEVEDVVIDINP
ncbi:hypothetical protein [Agrococcus sp. Ld7]|uniref:hypothetical protein n=1 Tax=Agrococcus sp. Ld7 TaxID=649148 RepID=UPI003867E803